MGKFNIVPVEQLNSDILKVLGNELGTVVRNQVLLNAVHNKPLPQNIQGLHHHYGGHHSHLWPFGVAKHQLQRETKRACKVQVLCHSLDGHTHVALPVSQRHLRAATGSDPVLSKVYWYIIRSGWPSVILNSFTHFPRVDGGGVVLLWGFRVVVPKKLKKSLLQELHQE